MWGTSEIMTIPASLRSDAAPHQTESVPHFTGIRKGGAWRKVSPHAQADQHYVFGMLSSGEICVQHGRCGFLPFMREWQSLLPERRALTGAVEGEYRVAARTRGGREKEVQFFHDGVEATVKDNEWAAHGLRRGIVDGFQGVFAVRYVRSIFS